MTYHWIVNAVPGNIRHDYDISAFSKRFPDAGAYVNEVCVFLTGSFFSNIGRPLPVNRTGSQSSGDPTMLV